MTIPPRFRVKTKVHYDVLFQDEIRGDDATLGLCDSEAKQIIIRANMSDTETFKTFIHECLHALEAEYKIVIPHKSIYGLERAIFKALKLNKWL